MNQRDLLKKLHDETPLTAVEALQLDELLEAQSSERVAHTVAALPEEEPSLAWRSQLNSRLAEMAPAPARKPWGRWLGVTGLVAAGVMAIAIVVGPFGLVPGGKAAPGKVDVSAEVLSAHQEDEMLVSANKLGLDIGLDSLN